MKFLLLFIAIIFLPTHLLAAEKLVITTQKLDYFHLTSSSHETGKLTFLGGLELESESEKFGGFSGIRLSRDGLRLYAVSDRAHWLTAKLKRDAAGHLTDLEQPELSCICRTDGTPYGSKHWGDSEALELDGSTAYIAFERLNRINKYALKDNHPGPPKQATRSLKSKNIGYNTGLEAVARAPVNSPLAGHLITIAEDSPDHAGNHRAFIADENTVEEFSITATDDYAITDAVFLENGDLLILERKYGLTIGLGVRIRQFSASKISANAILSGEIVMDAGITSHIDNMEGLAVWKNPQGQTILTLISDDNYNRIQRTLLLEFVLNN